MIVVIARVGAPHGVRGWVALEALTAQAKNIFDYQPWQALIKGQWQPIQVIEHKVRQSRVWVRFEGCTDRNVASQYRHVLIGVPRSRLPKLPRDECYWSDLIGLPVINTVGIELGKIDHLMETGTNDVLVIKGEKTHHLPWIKGQVIQKVDLAAGVVYVDWDENF